MPKTALSALLAALAVAAPALAASPPAEVAVSISPRLQAESGDYGGPREFPGLEQDLRRAVAGQAAKGGFTRLDLVLEDAVPNRPTPAMLQRCHNLSFRSASRGGAEVSGTAYGPSGPQPISFGWWSYDLAESVGSGIWSDAERAFALLGSELAHGHAPTRAEKNRPSSAFFNARGVHRAWGDPC